MPLPVYSTPLQPTAVRWVIYDDSTQDSSSGQPDCNVSSTEETFDSDSRVDNSDNRVEVVSYWIYSDGAISREPPLEISFSVFRGIFGRHHAPVALATISRETSLGIPVVIDYYQGCPACNRLVNVIGVTIPPTRMCNECELGNKVCSICRQIKPRREFINGTVTAICRSCRDTHPLQQCAQCAILFYSDEYPTPTLCPNCLEHQAYENRRLREQGGIRDYNYKPQPQFLPDYKPDELYLGIELETDLYPHGGGAAGQELMKLPLFDKHFYMKHDGSLRGGLEIVSHPAILNFHKEQFGWTEILARVKELGGKSHYTTTCGLHIHFNEDYLGNNRGERDARAITLCFLFEKFWNQMLKFSRREPKRLSFCQPLREKFRKMTNEQFAYLKGHIGRHNVVNLNSHGQPTIEVRIFRGTLNEPTLFAAFELVDFLVRLITTHTPAFIYRLSWEKLMGYIIPTQYPNLDDYVRWKKLKEGVPKCASSLENKED